jgi:hypothetical protein
LWLLRKLGAAVQDDERHPIKMVNRCKTIINSVRESGDLNNLHRWSGTNRNHINRGKEGCRKGNVVGRQGQVGEKRTIGEWIQNQLVIGFTPQSI